MLQLLVEHVVPGYLEFHRDLLFHQTDGSLVGPFFMGRICEAVLRQGGPWQEAERITRGAISELNDHLGHRPVATLESQKIEPYAHEWVRPVPIYVRGAGVAVGAHQEVVEAALKLLADTEDDLLRAACFDLKLLDELAVDPRAYDFEHPVNKRPNYHFGQWDPHCIDGQGRYRRYVVQQVTLDTLMKRLVDGEGIPHDELVVEAAAVLVGTILMAAGVSGTGPDTHDSTVTLSNLLPHIARYRDDFYERLIGRITGAHGERLRAEAKERKQPFGGARQHLNAELARRRASQLEHVHLAKIFARMGYAEAATKQANIVPSASARMQCQIDCWLTDGHQAIQQDELPRAVALLPQIIGLLRRAIECGAVIDPWNILGFDAHFSLFPAMENSVHDHRADELVLMIEQIFDLYSHAWSEAAARDDLALCGQIADSFHDTAAWWHQFAAHEVESVEAVNALDAYHAAERVAQALNLWHKGGAAAGDVKFWAPHAEMFDSPQAYALVIEALLQRNDFVASMALLVHWLGQAERVTLAIGESSFHELAEDWLLQLLHSAAEKSPQLGKQIPAALVGKFFDYLEANAETFWQVPSFALGEARANGPASDRRGELLNDDDDENDEELFDAAYDDMVFKDSTDDGFDGQIFETGSTSQDELIRESRRLAQRLAFLSCVGRLWKIASTRPMWHEAAAGTPSAKQCSGETLHRWIERAAGNRAALLELLDTVRAYRIPTPRGDHDSMVDYDQKRFTIEHLMEQIISTTVEMADAERMLRAAAPAAAGETSAGRAASDEERATNAIFGALIRGDIDQLRGAWPDFMELLRDQPLLYVPLGKGGKPRDIVAARSRQRALQDLLAWLPRIGLLVETCELLETAREMERSHPVGPGAVTEFDELFKHGYKAMVESLVECAEGVATGGRRAKDQSQSALVDCLEKLTESLLLSWLNHSRTLRLSVLEKVHDKQAWKQVVAFVERYGEDLFTQRFLNLSNIRSILHRGVDEWLTQLADDPDEASDLRLVADLGKKLPRQEAVEYLTLILESICENYSEYRDYNSTTTQSDRGELLYTLLDFLRLRSKYDRISWNLKPVVWAHEVLVRRSQNGAARMWRRALQERINAEADQYLAKLAELQKKYAMRMPTVADRLAERFIRPMAIDRIRALVAPAMQEAGRRGPKKVFELLEHETESLTRQPTGVGLDVPVWLVALEEEVEMVRDPLHEHEERSQLKALIPPVRLSLANAKQQLNAWAARPPPPDNAG